MEMSALPAALFCHVKIKDINPVYFTLMLNFLLAFAVCWLFKKFVIEDWPFGLQFQGVLSGLKKYGLPAVIATLLVTAAFCIELAPFDYKPTLWKVAIEGIVYYIGVGIMEELYLRGLLQNIIKKWFGERKHATLYAVFIAAALFGFGHIFGALGQPVATILAKTVWAAALGVYLGAVYAVSKNLWVPIILHFIINLCGISFCFSTSNQYPAIALITCLVSYVLLAVYGVILLRIRIYVWRAVDMKKTAILIYDSFCNFEISVVLEILAFAGKPITVFGIAKQAIRSEDGLSVLPDDTIDHIDLDEYDSLILPGAMDIRESIENEKIIDFIKKFDGKIIGAISIAPLLLVKAGLLSGKPFMAGVNKEEIFEEGFSERDLAEMVGWDDNLSTPVKEGHMITDNIITSISYNFVKWALAFGKMLGIDIPAKTFEIQSLQG